jgi:protein TonB
MVRSLSLGSSPLTIAVSVAVHAAVFVASAIHTASSSLARDEVVRPDVLTSVDVVTDPVLPAPGATVTRLADRAVTPRPWIHANTVASPDEPRLARPLAVAAPTGVADEANETPSFPMIVGSRSSGAGVDVARVGPPPGPAPVQEGAGSFVPEDAVDVRARLVLGVPPAYPDAARAEGIEGDVLLELVVGVTGGVESARVVRGVGDGLDEAAVRAASAFRFAPASKAGQPVRVRMPWPVRFRLE